MHSDNPMVSASISLRSRKKECNLHLKKHGIGRPGFVYMLTDLADTLFPKSYDTFAIEILNDINNYEGSEKLHTIFRRRKDKQLHTLKDALAGFGTFDDTVNGLKMCLNLKDLSLNSHEVTAIITWNSITARSGRSRRILKNYALWTPALSGTARQQVTREQNMAEAPLPAFIKSRHINSKIDICFSQRSEQDTYMFFCMRCSDCYPEPRLTDRWRSYCGTYIPFRTNTLKSDHPVIVEVLIVRIGVSLTISWYPIPLILKESFPVRPEPLH